MGETLGRYRVVEPIGEGAMATVYSGEHVVLGHRVAIKILHAKYLASAQMEHRFLREARAISEIRHPGIVELFDIGRAPDGRAYIIMELLHGESLRQRLESGPLDEATAIMFSSQIASALEAAHARGIIHRDLKPDNVLIVDDPDVPSGERIKVIDFGIAKRTAVDTPTPEITKSGVVLGTPEYMSPEQCAGASDLDARSDVYSLGVVMYQMATGRVPFVMSSTSEMLANHMYVASPPAREINENVSPAMDQLLSRCLAKTPEERYSSMQELRSDLAELEPRQALPPAQPAAPLALLPARRRAPSTAPHHLTRTTMVFSPRRRSSLPGPRWVPLLFGTTALAAAAVVGMLWVGSHDASTTSAPAVVPEIQAVAADATAPAFEPPAPKPAIEAHATPAEPVRKRTPPRADKKPAKRATKPRAKSKRTPPRTAPAAKPAPTKPAPNEVDDFASVRTPSVY